VLSSITRRATPRRHPRGGNAAATVAAAWALGFAALSAYWALGGAVAAGAVAQRLAEQAEAREPGFLALLWAAAAAKALLALLAFALRRPLRRAARCRAVAAASIAGAALVLYGAGGFADFVLMASGARAVPAEVGEHAVAWYLVLWEPLWILGGTAFLLAARRALPPLPDAGRGHRATPWAPTLPPR